MPENKQSKIDNVPESKAARWASRLSRIPFLGLLLYLVLAPIALYRIGSKGRTGFHLLRKGLILSVLYTGLIYAILFAFAFGPTWIFPFVENHGYCYSFYGNGNIEHLTKNYLGMQHGKEIWWYENGEKLCEARYSYGNIKDPYIYWDAQGNRIKDEDQVGLIKYKKYSHMFLHINPLKEEGFVVSTTPKD